MTISGMMIYGNKYANLPILTAVLFISVSPFL